MKTLTRIDVKEIAAFLVNLDEHTDRFFILTKGGYETEVSEDTYHELFDRHSAICQAYCWNWT